MKKFMLVLGVMATTACGMRTPPRAIIDKQIALESRVKRLMVRQDPTTIAQWQQLLQDVNNFIPQARPYYGYFASLMRRAGDIDFRSIPNIASVVIDILQGKPGDAGQIEMLSRPYVQFRPYITYVRGIAAASQAPRRPRRSRKIRFAQEDEVLEFDKELPPAQLRSDQSEGGAQSAAAQPSQPQQPEGGAQSGAAQSQKDWNKIITRMSTMSDSAASSALDQLTNNDLRQLKQFMIDSGQDQLLPKLYRLIKSKL